MKKFKYRIESYLKYTKHLRDKALEESKRAEEIKNNLLQKMAWMENEMKKAYKINSEMGKTINNIHLINDNNQFMGMLKDQMRGLAMELQKAENIYQDKFKKLIELQKKVRKLELHKENEFEKYKTKVKKIVQKRIDDINATRGRRKNAESL